MITWSVCSYLCCCAPTSYRSVRSRMHGTVFLESSPAFPPPPCPHGTSLWMCRGADQSPPPLPSSLQSPVRSTSVRGGSAVPVPTGHTHTQHSGWQTKPLVLPVKTSLHTQPLPFSRWRQSGRHDTIVVAFSYQGDIRDIFLSFAAEELRCWLGAERTAGRRNVSMATVGVLT